MCLGTLQDKVDILHATWQVPKNDIKRVGWRWVLVYDQSQAREMPYMLT